MQPTALNVDLTNFDDLVCNSIPFALEYREKYSLRCSGLSFAEDRLAQCSGSEWKII